MSGSILSVMPIPHGYHSQHPAPQTVQILHPPVRITPPPHSRQKARPQCAHSHCVTVAANGVPHRQIGYVCVLTEAKKIGGVGCFVCVASDDMRTLPFCVVRPGRFSPFPILLRACVFLKTTRLIRPDAHRTILNKRSVVKSGLVARCDKVISGWLSCCATMSQSMIVNVLARERN